MSKFLKALELDALRKRFSGVRDLVILSAEKINSQQTMLLRNTLSKQKIRLTMTKNTLIRKVFQEAGIQVAEQVWRGPTFLAYGAENVKALSTTIDQFITDFEKDPKQKDKIKVKTAVADGQEVTFEQAMKMPTRQEAIGELVGMLLAPFMAIAGQLVAPGGQLASQIEKIGQTPSDAAKSDAT
jgi:large subunit ribosomal protein L10